MLKVHQLSPRESFGSNMYILESNGEYALVDPSVDFLSAAARFPALKHALKYIILTHAHFDHFLEIDSWVNNTDASVLVGRFDAPALSDPYKNAYRIFFGQEKGYYGKFTEVYEGDELTLGDESFSVLSTPGHTPGGISLLFGDGIFVGDTVFADGGYGRYDLPGGDYEALAYSLRRIANMDKRLAVYPGHGRQTDINEIYAFFSNY
ncbi:MAG: MBL fold metallo-hydrolase [Clostridia bacterium]|nr:MBL fold metallo-hydrolase [Clostridia bacterium]